MEFSTDLYLCRFVLKYRFIRGFVFYRFELLCSQQFCACFCFPTWLGGVWDLGRFGVTL